MARRKSRGRPKGRKNRTKIERIFDNLSPEKQRLIKIIWELEPEFKELDIDLSKHSIKALQKHIDRVKRRKQWKLTVTKGQLKYELHPLLQKLDRRNIDQYIKVCNLVE